jgi:hypothetical protein
MATAPLGAGFDAPCRASAATRRHPERSAMTTSTDITPTDVTVAGDGLSIGRGAFRASLHATQAASPLAGVTGAAEGTWRGAQPRCVPDVLVDAGRWVAPATPCPTVIILAGGSSAGSSPQPRSRVWRSPPPSVG